MRNEPRHIAAEATSLMDLARRLATQHHEEYREQTEGPGDIVHAAVVDSFAHMHSYFVTAPHRGIRSAFLASPDSSLMPIGSKSHSMLMPGTGVLVWMPPDREWAVILGTRGDPILSRNLALPYSIVPASRVGLFDDKVHNALVFSDEDSTGVMNASAGRPVDTLPGEWGHSNEFGLMLHLGRLMATMKASETAGIYFYWLDNLVRLWAYNYEHFTAGSERYAYNDEGEFTDRGGSTPFPWEALGSFGPLVGDEGTKTTLELEDGALKPGSEAVSVEPAERDQAPIWRRQWFEGYLGGMHRDLIQAPRVPVDDQGEPTTAPERLSRQAIYPGLLEVHRGLNGSYAVRSAKEITHEKVILIPVPKQQKTPSDPLGDHKDGFSAAGRQWTRNGTQTPEVPDLKEFTDDGEVGERIAKLWEYHSYLYNVYNVQGFRLHPKDWAYPDEEDIEPAKVVVNGEETTEVIAGGLNDDVTPPAGDAYSMPLPKFGEIVIDHRTRARFYKSRSVIKQLEDGSILIEDGWGSQIRMERGHIVFTAPLDILMQPGRSLVGMAPQDVVWRAGNSMDMTASKRDVRIKAERNFHTLSGNGGEGGTLIESKGTPASGYNKDGEDAESGGVVLKSASAPIYLLGRNVGLRATEELMLIASKIRNTGDAVFSNDVIINNQLDVNTLVALIADIGTLNGLVLTPAFSTTVVAGPGPHAHLVTWAAQAAAPKTEDNSGPNEEVENVTNQAGFSLRTTAQYQLESGTFVWFENRWQQYYRRNGVGETWEEKDVVGPSSIPQQPYPGKSLWEGNQFRTIDHELFDLAEGRSKGFEDLDGENKEQSGAPSSTTLAGGYLITKQGRP